MSACESEMLGRYRWGRCVCVGTCSRNQMDLVLFKYSNPFSCTLVGLDPYAFVLEY